MRHLPFQLLLAGGMLSALLLAGTAAAKTPKLPCPPGTFILDPASLSAVSEMLGTPVTTLVISDDGSASLGSCAVTARVRAKRKKTTVTAAWPTCGTATKVVLKGAQAYPACSIVTGRVRAKG